MPAYYIHHLLDEDISDQEKRRLGVKTLFADALNNISHEPGFTFPFEDGNDGGIASPKPPQLLVEPTNAGTLTGFIGPGWRGGNWKSVLDRPGVRRPDGKPDWRPGQDGRMKLHTQFWPFMTPWEMRRWTRRVNKEFGDDLDIASGRFDRLLGLSKDTETSDTAPIESRSVPQAGEPQSAVSANHRRRRRHRRRPRQPAAGIEGPGS